MAQYDISFILFKHRIVNVHGTRQRRKTMRILSLIVSLLLLSLAVTTIRVETADLVLKNGNIYTGNEHQPGAEAVAVKGGRIVFVGSNRDVPKYLGPNQRGGGVHCNKAVAGLAGSHY